MPTIVNTTDCMRRLADGVTILLPGANEVSAEAWGLSQCIHTRELVAKGLLKIVELPKATIVNPKGGEPLAKLKEQAALKVIAACKDIVQLELWLDEDSRPRVREALTRRAYELAPAELESTSGKIQVIE